MPVINEQGRLEMWVRSNMCKKKGEIQENCETSEKSDPSGASQPSKPSETGQVDDLSNDSSDQNNELWSRVNVVTLPQKAKRQILGGSDRMS